jgi:catalase (peroxidase I)
MKTAEGLRKVFNRMGFNDQEIVALSGAHALGISSLSSSSSSSSSS